MQNILIINAHPDEKSLCNALANQYYKGAISANANVKLLNLRSLSFSPILKFGYRQRTELEPDLQLAREFLEWANLIVIVYPVWWASIPALLKGFFDRLFLPGITYQPIPTSPFPIRLLKGKTARLIITMDAPLWYDYIYYRNSATTQVKTGTLKYCGINSVMVTKFGKVKHVAPSKINIWLSKAYKLGLKCK
jgi:putative NADPH-quinone reductase